MKNKKIVIAGGTGFIGEELISWFGPDNDIVVLTRKSAVTSANNRNKHHKLSLTSMQRTRYVEWDGITPGPWAAELEAADVLINLAGRTVNCRYTRKNKDEILSSRIDANRALGAAIRTCIRPPGLWINASSATIYADSRELQNDRHGRPANSKVTGHAQDEYTGEFKPGFSVMVCQEWERTFYGEATEQTRKVALRMAITLGDGGVMIPYFNLLKFKLGGRQGSGEQMYSWIHEEDLCRMISFIEENKVLEGTFNASSPKPVSNTDFMQLLRKATGHRFGLPAYTWMLKLGAAIIGTETELVLKSRWVVPTRMLEAGFRFQYADAGEAINNIISKVPRKQYHL